MIPGEEADDEVGFLEWVGAENQAFAHASGHSGIGALTFRLSHGQLYEQIHGYPEKFGWPSGLRLADAALSTAQEYGVSVAANGTLYFASNRDGGTGSFDIYRANFKDGDCETPVNLGDVINTKGPEVQPAISPDENTLVFTAFGRDDEITGVHKDYNKGDLYISYRQDGVWTHPRNCGPAINSGGQESWPGFSSDGKRFFFSSERGFATYRTARRLTWRELRDGLLSVLNGMGNIYEVDAGALRR